MKHIKLLFNRLRSSKDGKTVLANFGYLSLLQIANYVFPLITLPYLARVLGVNAFGMLAIGTSVIAYFQTLIDYGFNFSTVKEIARHKNDYAFIEKIVAETMGARILFLIASYLIIGLCILYIPFFKENQVIILMTSTMLIGYTLMADWFFQAIEDMKFITIASVMSNLITTILVFVVIKKQDDYILQPLLLTIGMTISSIMCWCIMIRKYRIHIFIPSIRLIINRIKDGFNMFVSIFLPTIYTNLNVLLLGAYNGVSATGIYSGGVKFTSLAYRVTTLFSRVFYPFLARRMDKHNLYAKISIFIGFIISLFFLLCANPIVIIFLGEEFAETVEVLRIVALTPLAISIFNVYGTNYLAIKGYDRILKNIVVLTTVIGIIGGIFGAMYFSFFGVALCSLITQSVRAILAFYYVKKIKNNER